VGGNVSVSVRLQRNTTPAADVGLRLVGTANIRGGDGRTAAAVTDAQGAAVFQFAAGTLAGTYNLSLDAGDQELGGSVAVTVRVTAGAPVQVATAPDPLVVATEDVTLRVEVQDTYGNPVPGAPVALRASGEAGDRYLSAGEASGAGVFTASLSPEDLRGAANLVVVSGAATLGEIAVQRGVAEVAEIAVVAGAAQSADGGQTLDQPLVLEVKNADGDPVQGREVLFSAINGAVEPAAALTDAQGRATVRVTMGMSGTETEVVATAGDLSRSVLFPITRGGMALSEIESALAQAAALLAAGSPEQARVLFEQVAAAEPERLEARIGIAESYLVAGQYGEARERYLEILRFAPSRYDAQLGMARASRGEGRPQEAATWYELALTQNQSDPAGWVGLGDARADLGRTDAARSAYEQALVLDPDNEQARRGLQRLSSHPMVVETDLWGGNTFDNTRDASLRWVELRLNLVRGLQLWGAYDNALNFRHPYLVRGNVDIEAGYGGIGYSWGTGNETYFEYGRRTHPPEGTIQSTWTLGQAVGLGGAGWLRFEGWLGHWFDRDDWVVYGEAGFEVVSDVTLRPTLSYGDYAGSTVTRDPAKELRAGLLLRYEASKVGFEPGVAYGNVSSEVNPALDGDLWDATLRLWYAFSPQVALDSFVRYQAPPGESTDSGLTDFWTVAIGLRAGVRRPR
jgi:tetratricopeptide (TPR) repeat protein